MARTGLITGLAALTAASLLWHESTLHPAAERTPASTAVASSLATAEGAESQPTQAQLVNEIEAAQQAVTTEIGHPPLSGPVIRRPTFVSALEWRVLNGVAATHADPARELTRLVNRLRFTRLEALWRSLLAKSADAGLRHRLAQQLLDEIPGRVSAQQLDLAQAQDLQLQLLGDLVTDPIERASRASMESQRLGYAANGG